MRILIFSDIFIFFSRKATKAIRHYTYITLNYQWKHIQLQQPFSKTQILRQPSWPHYHEERWKKEVLNSWVYVAIPIPLICTKPRLLSQGKEGSVFRIRLVHLLEYKRTRIIQQMPFYLDSYYKRLLTCGAIPFI